MTPDVYTVVDGELAEASDPVRAATITATYTRHRRHWIVLIRPTGARRLTRTVPTEQDAIDLVRHFNRLGLAGVDLGQALAEARAESQKTYAPLREALPAFLREQVELGNLRQATAEAYRKSLGAWVYPALGAIPWNLLTREEIGAVILGIRKAGKSIAVIEQIRCPLTRFFQWRMHVDRWPGPNPAAELRFFIGKQPGRRPEGRLHSRSRAAPGGARRRRSSPRTSTGRASGSTSAAPGRKTAAASKPARTGTPAG